MTAAVSFPKLAALADAPFAYRDELGRECREALSTIDRLEAEVAKLRQDVGTLEVRGWQERCTPAERALIDSALALVLACRALDKVGNEALASGVPLKRLAWVFVDETFSTIDKRAALDDAADAVLAERGEA